MSRETNDQNRQNFLYRLESDVNRDIWDTLFSLNFHYFNLIFYETPKKKIVKPPSRKKKSWFSPRDFLLFFSSSVRVQSGFASFCPLLVRVSWKEGFIGGKYNRIEDQKIKRVLSLRHVEIEVFSRISDVILGQTMCNFYWFCPLECTFNRDLQAFIIFECGFSSYGKRV